MRLDPEHVRKLDRAINHATDEVKLDVQFMRASLDRLNPWERGLLTDALLRATKAKRRTIEQRVLLALFVHDDGTAS